MPQLFYRQSVRAHVLFGRKIRDEIVVAETGLKVILAVFVTLMFGPPVQAQDIQERYRKSCAMCHAAGAAGAPKTGSTEAWEPRLAKGMATLVQSVEKGLKSMPPKGMCFDCTSEEYEALILMMATPKE
jgi:cytochrome c5